MPRSFIRFTIACLQLCVATLAAAVNVATVNGVAISDAQLDNLVQQSGKADTPQLRLVFKNQLIVKQLLREEAAKMAIGATKNVQAITAEARDSVLVQQYLREAIRPNPVTEAQVKARYDSIVASLGEKDFKPRLIMVGDDATATSLFAQLKRGADFARLARDFSKSPSARNGGELDWVSFKLPLAEGKTQGYPLAIAQALVRLPTGGVTALPIAVGDQRFLLKLEEVRPTVMPQYAQVKTMLKPLLEKQELERATAALIARLLANAKIE